MKRIAALLVKELSELRQSPSIFLPAAVTGAAAILYPFVIAIIVPHFAGERLADSSDFRLATEVFRSQPEARGLTPEGAIQAFVFGAAIPVNASRLHRATAMKSSGASLFRATILTRDTHDTVATPKRNQHYALERFHTFRSHPLHGFRDLRRCLVISY